MGNSLVRRWQARSRAFSILLLALSPVVLSVQAQAGRDKPQCKMDVDCKSFEDGNLCNGTLYCHKPSGKCLVNPATTVACNTSKDSACAKSVCAPKTGKCELQFAPTTASCDDGSAFTMGDRCDGKGKCAAGKFVGECQKESDCAGKSKGNLCDGHYYCDLKSAKCKLNPASVVKCPSVSNTACSANTCNPATGKCEMKAWPSSQSCDDGNSHTQGDHCDGKGGCVAGKFTGECQKNTDCKAKEDGIACNGSLYCDKSTAKCKVNPATILACPSGKKCDSKRGCI